jgi:SP family sugar:H+ symporter-like MFS transporter
MQMAVIPTTLAELAPARIRGAMGVLYWLSIKIGGLVVTCITRGTFTIPSNAAWRIPFGLFLVIPSIVIALVWFTPESPRWLLLRDRQTEARSSLTRLKNKNVSSAEIKIEFDELSQRVAIQLQRTKFKDLFALQNRKRTFVVIFLNFFQQATGQAFASQYGTLFVKMLKSVNPFSITVGTNAVDIGALFISIFTIDRLGRR